VADAPQFNQERVKSDPLQAALINPNVASADSFGAPIAAGARSLSTAVIREEEKVKQERQDYAVMDADNKLVDASNDLVAKAMQVQGSNAIGLGDRTREDFNKLVEDSAKDIADPETKELFRRRAAQRWGGIDARVMGHAENQITDYKTKTLQGHIDRRGLEAIDSMDPAQIAQASNDRFLARQALSDLTGVDLEVEHVKDDSELYAAATERFLDAKDWKGAAEFYEQNKGKILPAVRDKVVEPALRVARIQGEAELATAEITSPRNGAIPTRTQAMSAASKIQDPEVKTRTMASVKALYVERDLSHEADQESEYSDLQKQLRENGGDINALPPGRVAGLDAKWWKTLQSDAKEFVGESTPTKKTYENIASTDSIRAIIDSGKITSVDAMRHELVYGATGDTQAAYPVTEAAVRSLAANSNLTAEQTQSVMDYMKQGGNKGALKYNQMEEAFQYVTGGQKYDDQRKKYPDLFNQVAARLPPGKEITADALNKAMAPLLAEGEIVDGGLYNANTTYGQAASQGKATEWLPNVSADEEKTLAKALRDVKVANITPDVVRKFKKYQVQGYPTPLRDGRPMTVGEAVLAGTLQGNKKDLPAAATPRPKATGPGKGGSAYDDTGAVRFSNED
jgi:hypothetical protein